MRGGESEFHFAGDVFLRSLLYNSKSVYIVLMRGHAGPWQEDLRPSCTSRFDLLQPDLMSYI